jgi:nicotinate-nucleotide pyrophosphorylase
MQNIDNLDELIKMALAEDICDGDHSTLACIPPTAFSAAKMVAKQDGILCGAGVAVRVFHIVDATLVVTLLKHDGDPVFKGDLILTVEGHSGSILTAERTALNYANATYPDAKVSAIAISAFNSQGLVNEPITPCGICRQALLETEMKNRQSIRVIMNGQKHTIIAESASDLLPLAFDDSQL